MMDAKERSCSCEQQSTDTPCLSSVLKLFHGETLIQEMHQWFQTSSSPCWCTESAEAVYVTVREVCSTVNRSDSVALAILFDSFMIDIANEHIADVMKSYVLLQELSEQYYDDLKNVPDSIQQTDITSFWESLHSFHMNLLQTLPNMSNKLLKRLGSLFLRNSLNYNLQNPFRVANCKALNVLIEKCSSSARVLFKNSHMPYFEELPEALQNAGDYDFQSSLVELLFRLSRAKERSASVAKWFPNLPYTYQCLFTRIVDFDPDCRSFLIAFNSHLGTSRLVHTVPAFSIFVGGVKIMKPSIESYKKLWMDFNIGSGSVSILFDKRDPSIASPDREWETLIIYKTEVLSVSLVQTLHGQTLNMTLNQSVIDYVYSVFPKLNANQSDSFLIAEFNSECEDVLKALQLLYPEKLKVVSRLPRPSPYLGTKKKSSVSVGSLHANKYSKSPVNGAASHSSSSDPSERSRKRVKRLSYSSSGVISKPKRKASVTSSCVGLKFYSDTKQLSPDDDEIIPSTYTTPGSESTNVTISNKLKSLENRSLESSKRSRISDQSSYETPKSGRIIKSVGGENRKTIYPDTSPETDPDFTSVEATRGSAAVHDPSPIVEETKISQSEEIVDPQCTSDVNIDNRQTEDTTSEQLSPAPNTADLAEDSKVSTKVLMIERTDTVTSLNSSTHLPHLNVDEVIEQIHGPDCEADESKEEAGVDITANVNKQKNEVRSFNDTSLLWSEDAKNSTNALSLRKKRNIEQSESPDFDIISSVSVMSTQDPISEQLLLRRSKTTATEPTTAENLNEKTKTSSDEEIIPPTVQPEKTTPSKSQISFKQKNIEKPNDIELESLEISANVDEVMEVEKPVDDMEEELDHSELSTNLQQETETVKNANETLDNKLIEKENDLENTYLKEAERNLIATNERSTLDNEIIEKKICSNIVSTNENANLNRDCVKLADAEKAVDEHAITKELITTEENRNFESDVTSYNEANFNSFKRKGDGSESCSKEINGATKRLKLSTDNASSPTSTRSYNTKDVSHVSGDGQTNVKDLDGNSEKKECLIKSSQSSLANRSVHGCERVEPTKTLTSEEVYKTSSVKTSVAMSDEMIYNEVITDLAEATDNKLENATSELNNLHNLKELLCRPVVDDVQMRVVTIQFSEKLDILELKSQIVSPVKEKSVIDSATLNISSDSVKRLDESTRLISTTYTNSTSEKSGSRQKKRKVNPKNKLPDHYFAGGNKIERMKAPLQVAPDIKTGGGCKRKLFRKTSSILLGTPPMAHSPAKERSLNKSTFTVSGIMPLDQSSVLEESRAQPLSKRKIGKVINSIHDKSCVEVSFVSDCQLEAPKVTRMKRKSGGKREKQFFKRVKSPWKEKPVKKNDKHERLFSMSETSSNCETIYPNTTKDNLLSDKDAHIYSDPPSSDYSWLKSFYTKEKQSKKVNQYYGKSYLRKAKKSSDDEYSPNKNRKARKSRMSEQSKTRTRNTKTTKWPSPLPSRNLRKSNKQKDFKKFASYSSGTSLDDVTEEVNKGNSNAPITSFVSKLEDRSVEIMRDCTHSSYNQSVNLTDYSLYEEKNKKRTSSNVPKINLQPLDDISLDDNSSFNKLIDEDLLLNKLVCLKPQKRGRKSVKNINIPPAPFNTPASKQSTPLIREKNMMKGLQKMTANISSIEVVQSADHSSVMPCNDRILFISDSQGASAPKHQRPSQPDHIKSPCEPNPVLDFSGNMKVEVMDEYENIPAVRTTFEGSSTEQDDQMQKPVRVSLSRNCSDCSGNVDGTAMNEAKLSSAFDDIFKGSSQNTWSLQCGQKPGIYDVTKLNTKEDNVTPERLEGRVLFQDDVKLSNEDITHSSNCYNSDEIIPATAEDDVDVGNEEISPPGGVSAVVSPIDGSLAQVPLSFLREMKAQRLKEIQILDSYIRRFTSEK